MEKAAPPGLSPLFLPHLWAEKGRFSGFTKSDLVFSKSFVIFRKCYFVPKQLPAKCKGRLFMLK